MRKECVAREELSRRGREKREVVSGVEGGRKESEKRKRSQGR